MARGSTPQSFADSISEVEVLQLVTRSPFPIKWRRLFPSDFGDYVDGLIREGEAAE